MEQKSPEIYPTYGHLILTKLPRQFNGKRKVFSMNYAGQLDIEVGGWGKRRRGRKKKKRRNKQRKEGPQHISYTI